MMKLVPDNCSEASSDFDLAFASTGAADLLWKILDIMLTFLQSDDCLSQAMLAVAVVRISVSASAKAFIVDLRSFKQVGCRLAVSVGWLIGLLFLVGWKREDGYWS
jgi:hypothetical protein